MGGAITLWDWPTKLAVIVAKTDPSTLRYVVEALYTHMLRNNAPDPYGVSELKRVVPEILWARTYVKAIARQYPELLKSPTDPVDKQGTLTLSLVTHFLDSPSNSL